MIYKELCHPTARVEAKQSSNPNIKIIDLAKSVLNLGLFQPPPLGIDKRVLGSTQICKIFQKD